MGVRGHVVPTASSVGHPSIEPTADRPRKCCAPGAGGHASPCRALSARALGDPGRPFCSDREIACPYGVGEVEAAGRGPRRGLHARVDGRGDARPGQGRDRADRLPLSRASLRVGNFLVPVLRRKLAAVELKFGKSEFEKRHYALLRPHVRLRHRAARRQHRRVPREHARDPRRLPRRSTRPTTSTAPPPTCCRRTSSTATRSTMLTSDGEPITFAEWGYLGKGKFQRRDFRFDTLTQMSSFGGGHAVRRARQARDLHAGEELSAADGRRSSPRD